MSGGTLPPIDGGSCSLPADAAARWIAFDSDRVDNNRDIYLVRADGSQLLRLTTDPTTEEDPAFSNSGTSLAFASDRSGSTQVYVMNLGTLAVTQLTSLANGADQPSWSSDDSQIVFHSGLSVYIMAADGSNPRVVATGLNATNSYQYPSLTPDDSQVIFDRENEVDTINVDGTGLRYVIDNTTTTIETPALSPDGVTVAFAVVQTSAAEQIAVAPFADSTNAFTAQDFTPLSSGSARRPAWGPAGVMAFEHGPSGNGWPITTATIALSSAPGTTPCDLVGPPGDNRDPNWAPAGFQPKGP